MQLLRVIGILSTLCGAEAGWAQAPIDATPLALDEAALDRSANACDDFYQFACGGWVKNTTIPEDKSGWSRGFYDIAKRNEAILRAAMEKDAADLQATGEHRQIGDFYAACMDESKVETASLLTLKRRIKTLSSIKDPKSLALQVARAHLEGSDVLFGFGQEQDAKDSSLMIAGADQGGLGLPDRDYYLSDEAKKREIRGLYQTYITDMLVLNGASPKAAAKDAAAILKIETALAKGAMDRVERRDPTKLYHRLERQGLEQLAPSFDWKTYFAAIGIPDIQTINVEVPAFFSSLEQILKTTPKAALRTYISWHILSRSAPMLPNRFVDTQFRYNSAAFTGQKVIEPRWKRCVAATTHALNHPTSKAYIETTFGGTSKTQTQDMIREIEAAFGETLQHLSWMDDATRVEAEAKLKTLVNQIGYPDVWRDYSNLRLGRDSYLANALQSASFESRFALAKIGRPVDRTEWGMPASMVNAYYDAENNKMVFPAGILQPPFFASTAPAPVNYGGIGMVMGHELTHGFDDQGRKFDAKGNMRDWWSANVAKEFDKGVDCLDKQYSAYTVLDGLHVNGKLTMGENIADQGGIHLAFDAWLRKSGGQGDAQAGFTPAQQLFLGYAQSWCTTQRPERQRSLITMDPHSPPRFRVNGPLANFDEFSKAFGCKAGDKMAPENRCKIW